MISMAMIRRRRETPEEPDRSISVLAQFIIAMHIFPGLLISVLIVAHVTGIGLHATGLLARIPQLQGLFAAIDHMIA